MKNDIPFPPAWPAWVVIDKCDYEPFWVAAPTPQHAREWVAHECVGHPSLYPAKPLSVLRRRLWATPTPLIWFARGWMDYAAVCIRGNDYDEWLGWSLVLTCELGPQCDTAMIDEVLTALVANALDDQDPAWGTVYCPAMAHAFLFVPSRSVVRQMKQALADGSMVPPGDVVDARCVAFLHDTASLPGWTVKR